ncbi:MAG TPA: sigma-70 family RNA polymerase sigma factor [Pirellulaceae bacterium]
MSEYDEAEGIALARTGDAEGFSRLLDHYRPRIVALAASLMSPGLRQKVDPEDITQEALLSCVRAFPEINFAETEPWDWICQVVRRRVMDAGRRFVGTEKRAIGREVTAQGSAESSRVGWVDLLVMTMTTPSAAFSRDQRMFRVAQAMEQLPEDGRAALRMRYLEALPSKEIAARMRKSDGAVRVLLTRTLQQLRQALGDELNPFGP